MTQDSSGQWHLDRKVPITLIVVLITQLVIGGMVLSEMRSDIANTQRDVSRIDAQVEATRTTVNVQAVQLGRIEENTRATQQAVQRLLQRFDQ